VALFDLLVLASFGYLALGAQRNAALLAIAAAPIAVLNVGAFLDRRSLPAWVEPVGSAVALWVIAASILASVEGEPWRLAPLETGRFPVAAVDWIEREAPPGPIFHAMGDGGYLISRLYPDYPVMVDGRLEVFGPQRFAKLRTAAVGRPEGFLRLDQEYDFGVALIHYRFFPGMHLLAWLHRSPEWRLVAIDEVAAVYARSREGAAPWPEADPAVLAIPVQRRRSARDLQSALTRVLVLWALDQPQPAVGVAREICERYPGDDTRPVHCDAPESSGLER